MTEMAKTSEAGSALAKLEVHLPAVVGPPSPEEWRALKEQAAVIARSGLAPRSANTPEKVLVIALKARELRLPPMVGLSHIYVVEGRPTLSAEIMAALVHRAGHRLRVIETTAERCVVEGERSDDPGHPQRVTWTMDDARRAGVGGKGPWRSYPAAMLRARAISALCRFAFADVLMGAAFTPEELGADVDEDGRVIEAVPKIEPSPPDPDVAVEGEVVEGSEEDGVPREHEAAVEEVRRMLKRFPEASRPDEDGALDYAGRDLTSAHKALRRLQTLWEERWGSPGAAVTTEASSGRSLATPPGDLEGPIRDEQLDYLRELADELYDDRDPILEGHEWLQRRLGHPLEGLSARKAYALGERLQKAKKEREEAAG